MIRIGKMRKRITLQTEGSPSADGGGGFTQSWTDIDTVWGSIIPLSEREVQLSEAAKGVVTHKITIRHRTDVDTGDRISFGSRIFNIKGAINVEEKGRHLEMVCEEGVAT